MTVEAVFLGINDAGEEVYEWLNNRSDVEVKALLTEKEQLDLVKELRPDLVISSGFEHIVPEEILEIPEKGIVNLHPSYLPFNRGAYPYIWPIIDGSPAGVAIHYMDKGLDTGPVIARKKVELKSDDTASSLRERLMAAQAELFKKNWPNIYAGKEGEEQDLEKGSMHHREDLDEVSRLDLNEEMTLEEAIGLLRGLSYGDKGLGVFEKDGKFYNLKLEVEEVNGSN